MKLYLQLVVIILQVVFLKEGDGTREHTKLLMQLLSKTRYSPEVRPVDDIKDVIQVQIRITLHQLRELDEKNQFITTNVWIRFFWNDAFLRWKPIEHGNITRMLVRASNLWQPDIILYNSVDTDLVARDFMADTNAEISYDGTVSWTAPAQLKSSCGIQIKDYPFDKQKCKLKFGSWTFHGFEINVSAFVDKILLDEFIPDGEWDVTSAPCERNEVFYSCCPEPYPDITCYINLERKPLFYVYNLVFPCILLIIIGGLVFFLPAASGERISLAVTLLLAMTVFMLVIMENIPETSETVPALQEFIGATIVLLTLATVTSIFIVNFHHQGESGNRPPRWVRQLVFNFLARLLCVKVADSIVEFDQAKRQPPAPPLLNKTFDKSHSFLDDKRNGTGQYGTGTLQYEASENAESDNESYRKTLPAGFLTRSSVEGGKITLDSVDILRAIYYKISSLRKLLDVKDDEAEEAELVMEEWRVVSNVTDRLFLLLFCTVTLVIVIKIFF